MMNMLQTASLQNSDQSEEELRILRGNVNQLQRQLNAAYVRINELVDERDEMRGHLARSVAHRSD